MKGGAPAREEGVAKLRRMKGGNEKKRGRPAMDGFVAGNGEEKGVEKKENS
jgi:hypothetical protein